MVAFPPVTPTSMAGAMSFTMCRAMAIAGSVAAVAAVIAATVATVAAVAAMAAVAVVLSTDGKYRWKMMEKYGKSIRFQML